MTSRTLSKEKVVDTAVKMINNQENLTFTNLGKKLGTRAQAIYNYYPDVTLLRVAMAVDFFNKLTVRIKADLLGMTGKQALKTMAHVCTQYSLDNWLVANQIFEIPIAKKKTVEMKQSIDGIYEILQIYLQQLTNDEQTRIVIARMLRNLIIGEIVHVGNGRFDNKLISARDSFDKMLDITLDVV